MSRLLSKEEAESEAKSGADALGRLNIFAKYGVEFVRTPEGETGWRSRVSINGRTAGQLALEVRAARQS